MEIFCKRTFHFVVWLPIVLAVSQFLVVCSTECTGKCDELGTFNSTCDNTTGILSCVCKSGYQGSLCDSCKDGYFHFNSSQTCQLCDCSTNGALNNTCDRFGHCFCKGGVEGDKCDSCTDGYYNLTANGCETCKCNGHSQQCDKITGVCDSCSNHTIGNHCENCELNYYRDDTMGPEDACESCPCSERTSSQTCHYDPTYNNGTGDVICDSCKEGYSLPVCGDCADNYFMDNVTCIQCDCNGNINETDTGNCDPMTGQCLKCLYNTTGDHCDECLPGYHGDPIDAKNCTGPDYTPDQPTTASARTNIITIAVIALVVIIIVAVVIGFYCYRQRHYRKTPLPFWTIELRKDDSMSFNDYHNLDSSLIDDVLVAPRGQLRMGDPNNYERP
ncbi:multiple epidermal growth factor-like domains protein 9 isoform X2 [Glandiceps talaboti]